MKMISTLRQKALNLLSRREHSRFELAEKLKRYEASAVEIAALLDILETQQLLNEARFAEAYCHMRFKKGYGPIRIVHELEARGVARRIVCDTVAKIPLADWLSQIEVVRQKKFGEGNATTLEEKFKQSQFLYYRGFNSDQIKAVV
jgi:regulatory protein